MDTSSFWSVSADDPGTITPATAGEETADGGPSRSRENGLKDGLRSKVLFPEEMAREIAAVVVELTPIHTPRNRLERWLVAEIARTRVQYQRCGALLDQDMIRVHERIVGPEWEQDRTDVAARLAGRIRKDPYRFVRLVQASKQGTELMIYHWECLEECLLSNGKLSEAQMDKAFDLLGVPVEYRDGSLKVPAADNTQELGKLVGRELTRLRASLPGRCDKDEQLRHRAAQGEALEPDATTRRHKSDEARAFNRLKWATATLDKLKAGVPAASLIDPETKRPIEPGPPIVAVARPAPAPSPVTPADPAPAAASAVPASTSPRKVDVRDTPELADCSQEDRAIIASVRAEYRQRQAAGELPARSSVVPQPKAG
jgi:hypothetical protein